ncbi:MAG: bifunctional phosphopantothenoylcysteine decarboxylase/phosphopantothenate--cysteine ligase CoaBC [Pseudomonadota bacterium]
MSVPLRGKHIVLGITGSVAAYKAAELARLLVKAGAEVQTVVTAAARAFVGDATFQAITGRVPRGDLFDLAHEAAMGHIELARWADLVLIAPASANTLARLAAGLADDLLATLCLATPAPLAVAPAMNQAMWGHAATRANLDTLGSRGVRIWGPDEGDQACGDTGPGRMLEPAAIFKSVEDLLGPAATATRLPQGLSALVTAGPTREPLDPVRFLGNRSSGKMGYAVAAALARAGARVTLVSGPVEREVPAGVARIEVDTAVQMHDAVMARAAQSDLFVATAAVADYRPQEAAAHKIKKNADSLTLSLVRNPDILAAVAGLPDGPFCVGFAAETRDLEPSAEAKRRAKGVDVIAANLVGEGQGFERDENALTLLWEGGRRQLARAPKTELADRLVSLIAERMHARTPDKNT